MGPPVNFESRNDSYMVQNSMQQDYYRSTSYGNPRPWSRDEQGIQPSNRNFGVSVGRDGQQATHNTPQQNYDKQMRRQPPFRDLNRVDPPLSQMVQFLPPRNASAIQETEIGNYQQRGQNAVPHFGDTSSSASFSNGIRGREDLSLRYGPKEIMGSTERAACRDSSVPGKSLAVRRENVQQNGGYGRPEYVQSGNAPSNSRSQCFCGGRVPGEDNFRAISSRNTFSANHPSIGSKEDNKMGQAMDHTYEASKDSQKGFRGSLQPGVGPTPELFGNREGSLGVMGRVVDSDSSQKVNSGYVKQSSGNKQTEDGNGYFVRSVLKTVRDEINPTSFEAPYQDKGVETVSRNPEKRSKQMVSVGTQTDPFSEACCTKKDLPCESSATATQTTPQCTSFKIELAVSSSDFCWNGGGGGKSCKPTLQYSRRTVKPKTSRGVGDSPLQDIRDGDSFVDDGAVTAIDIEASGGMQKQHGYFISIEKPEAATTHSLEELPCEDGGGRGAVTAIESAANLIENETKCKSNHDDHNSQRSDPNSLAKSTLFEVPKPIVIRDLAFEGVLANFLKAPFDAPPIYTRSSSTSHSSFTKTFSIQPPNNSSPTLSQKLPKPPSTTLTPPHLPPHLSTPPPPNSLSALKPQSPERFSSSASPSDIFINNEHEEESLELEMPVNNNDKRHTLKPWQTIRTPRVKENLLNGPHLARWGHDNKEIIRDDAYHTRPWLKHSVDSVNERQLAPGQSSNTQQNQNIQRVCPSTYAAAVQNGNMAAQGICWICQSASHKGACHNNPPTGPTKRITDVVSTGISCWICNSRSHLTETCPVSKAIKSTKDGRKPVPFTPPAVDDFAIDKINRILSPKPTVIQACWYCHQYNCHWYHTGEYPCQIDGPGNREIEKHIPTTPPMPSEDSGWGSSASSNSDNYATDWNFPKVEPIYKPRSPPRRSKSPQGRTVKVPVFKAKMSQKARLLNMPDMLDTFQPASERRQFQRKSRSTPRPTGIHAFPTEILDNIFNYLADGILADEQMPIKDYNNGYTFETDGRLNIRRNYRLCSVIKTCRLWRIIGQNIIYKVIHITNLDQLESLVNTILHDSALGEMVQAIRINLKQTLPNMSWRNQGTDYRFRDSASPTPEGTGELFFNLMINTPHVQVLSANMYGCAIGFEQPDGFYSGMRDLQIKDDNRDLALFKNFWRNLKRYPNLQRLKVCHPDQNTEFDRFEIHLSTLKGVFDHGYPTLTSLTFESAPEISDAILLPLVQRLPKLEKLAILDCKLVTSGGLARALRLIPNKLIHLAFWVWVDCRGNPSEKERKSYETEHLCDAIRECGHSLRYLNLKAFQLCEDLWRECDFQQLGFCRIAMLFYRNCNHTFKSGDDRGFKEAFETAISDGRLPGVRGGGKFRLSLRAKGVSFRN
ncbi:hypothetical protein RUND412_001586 [Rhizina undulata]